MKQLGYSEELFKQLDEEIQEKVYYNYNVDSTGYVERYGKKYTWIAYFELYGYFLLNEIQEPEYDKGFRVAHIDIDPTFPQKPSKIQLITECFLPTYQEDVQAWITQEKDNYLERYYIINSSSLFMNDEHEWILLRASLDQKGSSDTRIRLFLNTLLIESKFTTSLINYYFHNNRTYANNAY